MEMEFIVNKETKTVLITKDFDAPRDMVWDAYTKPELLDQCRSRQGKDQAHAPVQVPDCFLQGMRGTSGQGDHEHAKERFRKAIDNRIAVGCEADN